MTGEGGVLAPGQVEECGPTLPVPDPASRVFCEGKYPLATGLSHGTLRLCLIHLGLALGDTCEPLKPLCFSVFKIMY